MGLNLMIMIGVALTSAFLLCGPRADSYCCLAQNCTQIDNTTECSLPALIYCCEGLSCVPSDEWWAGAASVASADYDYDTDTDTDKGAMP